VVAPPTRADAADGRRIASETQLVPGRALLASLVSDYSHVQPSDLVGTLSWESGLLTFSNEPLQSAVERVNRYANTRFAIADAGTARLPVSGVYPTSNPEAFAEGITGVLPVRLELRNGVRTFIRADRPAAGKTEKIAQSSSGS